MYYAQKYPHGRNVRSAHTGEEIVEIYGYPTIEERHEAVLSYRAPNHCPQADLVCVKADNPNVRRAKRHDSIIYPEDE